MNHERVAHLLEMLLQRTEAEVTVATICFGPSFTAEMQRALELRRLRFGTATPASSALARSEPANPDHDAKTIDLPLRALN